MQFRVLPVLEAAVTPVCGTREVKNKIVVLEYPDLIPDEQVLALCAKPHLVDRPPLLQGIMRLEKLKLSAFGESEQIHPPVL